MGLSNRKMVISEAQYGMVKKLPQKDKEKEEENG